MVRFLDHREPISLPLPPARLRGCFGVLNACKIACVAYLNGRSNATWKNLERQARAADFHATFALDCFQFFLCGSWVCFLCHLPFSVSVSMTSLQGLRTTSAPIRVPISLLEWSCSVPVVFGAAPGFITSIFYCLVLNLDVFVLCRSSRALFSLFRPADPPPSSLAGDIVVAGVLP